MASCKYYENNWKKIEDLSINLAWTKLSSETQVITSKRQLKEIFWRVNKQEKEDTRIGIVKCLVQEKTIEQIQTILKPLREIKDFLDIVTNIA